MRQIEIFIDGASRGNPGPSGIGVVICKDGETVKNISSFIGETTNNVAEYTALIYGLKEALSLGAESIKVNTDSQLLQRQINKIYKIKSKSILQAYNQASQLKSAFKDFHINYIPRENNRGADKLANKAIEQAIRKVL